VKGDVIDVIPAYSTDIFRIELFGDPIERLSWIDKNTMEKKETLEYYFLFPARHFVSEDGSRKRAMIRIRKELEKVLPTMDDQLKRHRLETRTNYDLEMIEELGYCKGIENYSRHFDGRKSGEKPYCLIDYFPDDFLMVIDESHQMIPQIHGMYKGDRARKESLIEYGFRLPSAIDNRPLQYEEFAQYLKHVVFVSATPAAYELGEADQIVEQIIRPTGLIDPIIEHHKITGQMAHLVAEIEQVTNKGWRTLVTTLTKRMAEELTDYLSSQGIRVRYLHSEIQTLERTELIRQLRAGNFDVLVGINLLREGLDIPEVALVAILDADKEGFLRNERSLVQTIGRAARNAESKVILYHDKDTDSIKRAVAETYRRRDIQVKYNVKHGITPKTIIKEIKKPEVEVLDIKHIPKGAIPETIEDMTKRMNQAADELNFELAIVLRERMKQLQKRLEKK
jgi:excinuclease ABC subunit B